MATATAEAPASPQSGPSVRLEGSLAVLRVGPVSTRVDRRAVAVSLTVAAAVVLGGLWSLTVGDFPVPPADVVGELLGTGGSPDSAFIVRTLRLPRVLTAVLVGVGFGISGQIFQRMVRNPLASPDIVGVSAGAAVGAVFCIVVIGASSIMVTGSALAGSVIAVALIYVLAIRQGLSSYRLVLVGIGITAMLTAVVAYLLTRADLFDAQRAAVWVTGSLNGRGWEYVAPLSASLAVLLPVSLFGARSLRVLELGDDTAAGLGVGLKTSKLALSLSGAALAAIATAAAGPVGFVALVSPQIARRLVGNRSVGLVPAGLIGAAILVYADLLGRRLFAPTELPVGVITALVGAPYLLWLLARSNKIGTGG